MGFFDALGGGLFGTIGLLSSSNALAQARREREQSMSEYSRWLDQQNSDALMNNLRALYMGQGSALDQTSNFARNLGDSMSKAGVYNSTATSSAVQQGYNQGLANAGNSYTNADMARRQQQNQGHMQMSQMRYGQANNDYSNAQSQQNESIGGLASWLGGMVQSNLAKSGANTARMAMPQQNGTMNQAQGLPGNAGNIFRLPSQLSMSVPGSMGGYGQMPTINADALAKVFGRRY